MKAAVATCVCLAVTSFVLALIGSDRPRDPDCYDPPCSGDALAIYGALGALAFGGAAVVLGLAWAVMSFGRDR